MGKKLVAFCCAVLCFGMAVFAQQRIDARRAEAGEQLLYLPNTTLLRHFTAGMTSVVADILWIHCVQYTGKHVLSDSDFTWMKKMIETVVALDPHFTGVYLNGAIFLNSLQSDHQAAIDLLERGFVENPRAWELAHQIAMIHLVDRREAYGSDRLALHYLTLSANTGNAPDHVADLASKLQSDYDLFDIEEEMWERIKSEGGELKRDLAERKLRELSLRRYCKTMNAAAETFQQRNGRAPESPLDLVRAGLLGGIPEDPLGGRFIVTADGVIHSTTLLDGEEARHIGRMRIALDEYHKDNGVWPPNLEALIEAKKLFEIPPHPYPGDSWQYEPATGVIE